MAKITEHVVFDIDELVSFGTVKLSSATLEAFKEHLDEKETGHHVGTIALIHSSRAATNARLAEQKSPDPEYPTTEPSEDAELPEDQVETVPLPVDYTAEEKAAMVPGDVPAPPETPEHEWIRKEQEAKHEG